MTWEKERTALMKEAAACYRKAAEMIAASPEKQASDLSGHDLTKLAGIYRDLKYAELVSTYKAASTQSDGDRQRLDHPYATQLRDMAATAIVPGAIGAAGGAALGGAVGHSMQDYLRGLTGIPAELAEQFAAHSVSEGQLKAVRGVAKFIGHAPVAGAALAGGIMGASSLGGLGLSVGAIHGIVKHHGAAKREEAETGESLGLVDRHPYLLQQGTALAAGRIPALAGRGKAVAALSGLSAAAIHHYAKPDRSKSASDERGHVGMLAGGATGAAAGTVAMHKALGVVGHNGQSIGGVIRQGARHGLVGMGAAAVGGLGMMAGHLAD